MRYDILAGSVFQRTRTAQNLKAIYGENKPAQNTFNKSEADVFNDMIEKGEISETIGKGYGPGNQAITFNKTGKEIKEKIPSCLAALEANKVVMETQLTSLQEAAGIAPTRRNTRMQNIPVPYLRYEYEFCSPKYLGNEMYEERTTQHDCCEKYNSIIWAYNDLLDDIDTLNVLLANLEDGKKYTFSVNQLIALNFK